jgi:hypothetical protein
MARTSPQPTRRPAIGGNFDLLKKALVAETNPVRFRQGKVIAYSSVANTVDVQIAGATDDAGNAVVTAGIKLFGNFTPDVNQAVWLVTDNTDIFAIGQLAPYGSAGGGGGTGNVAYQPSAPSSPSVGDVWIESDVDIYDVATYAMTFTNKTINLTSNTLTGTKAQFNTAMSDADFVTIDGTETLANKTLTAPTLTGVTSAVDISSSGKITDVLPAPVIKFNTSGSADNVFTITATSFADVSTTVQGTIQLSIVCPSALYAIVDYSAWLTAGPNSSAESIRVSTAGSGATTWSAGGAKGWGNALFTTGIASNGSGSGASSSFTTLLNAGTTTITMQAYKTASGLTTASISFPYLSVTPTRWA